MGGFLLYAGQSGRPCVADAVTRNNWVLLKWKDALPSGDGSIVIAKADDSEVEWKRWEGVTCDAVIKLMEARIRR
jgi:hypothetical protein